MSMDVIGDFLTVIRNGIMASKRSVIIPYSKMKAAIADILKEEGFIKNVLEVENNKKQKQLEIILKYAGTESVIHELKRISKPGGRVYKKYTRIKPVIGGLGISILTTSKGIMTNRQAEELSLGGEILCTVW